MSFKSVCSARHVYTRVVTTCGYTQATFKHGKPRDSGSVLNSTMYVMVDYWPVNVSLTLLWYNGVYVAAVLFDSLFF
jgi:hypothetical protein